MAALLLCSGGAEAATMTFTGGPFFGSTHSENGIMADAGYWEIGSYDRPGTAHLADGGSSLASSIAFKMTRVFSALSFDLLPGDFDFIVCDWDNACARRAYENVRISGFRGKLQVADSVFDMGSSDRRVFFGSAFRDIDRLVIGFTASPRREDLPEGWDAYRCSPCSHYSIDNVTLAAVPLPPAVLSLAAALGLIGAVGRRKAVVSANR